MDVYKEKYLKYKSKYIDLKNKLGGSNVKYDFRQNEKIKYKMVSTQMKNDKGGTEPTHIKIDDNGEEGKLLQAIPIGQNKGNISSTLSPNVPVIIDNIEDFRRKSWAK